MTRILLSIFIVTCLFSCMKSKLNSHCWGEKEEAVFFSPSSLCGSHIFLDSNKHVIINKIPKEFLEGGDSLLVHVSYKLVDAIPKAPPCGGEKDVKIRCIQKR